MDAYEREQFITREVYEGYDDEIEDIHEYNPELAQQFGIEEERAKPAGSEKPSRMSERRGRQFLTLQNGKIRRRPHRRNYLVDDLDDGKIAKTARIVERELKEDLTAQKIDYKQREELDADAELRYIEGNADRYEYQGWEMWGEHGETEHPDLAARPDLRRGYREPQEVTVRKSEGVWRKGYTGKQVIDPKDLDKPEEKWERKIRADEDRIWRFGSRNRR